MIDIKDRLYLNIQEQVWQNTQAIRLLMSGIKIQGKGTTLPASPEVGEAYILEEGGKNNLYLYFSTGWSNMGEFPAQGPQGIPGPQGDAAQIGNVTASATTVAAGSQASVSAAVEGTNVSFLFEIPRGSQGAQGPRGLKGETGPQGPEGPQGPQGDTGYTIRILGVLADYEDLPTPASVGYGGGYLIGSSPYNLYIVTGAPGSLLWTNVGPVTPQTITVDANMSPTSENPVQNKVINAYLTLISGNLSIVAGKVTALESSVSEINNRQLPNIYYELADLKEIVFETVAAVAEYTVDPCDSFATPLYITIDDVAYPVLEDADAELSEILGRSTAYNQKLGSLTSTSTQNGVTFTRGDDSRTYSLSGTAGTGGASLPITSLAVENGHKYLISTGGSTAWNASYCLYSGSYNYPAYANPAIITGQGNETIIMNANVAEGTDTTGKTMAPCSWDLTQMYGAGNEPTSVDDPRILRLVNEAPIAANAGEIKDSVIESLESVGFNQWDEEYVTNGYYNASGVWTSGSYLSSKNPIPVSPNRQYCFGGTFDSSKRGGITFWDADMNFISRNNSQQIVTTPSNCAFIHFNMASSYGTVYNHDICINVSNASLNGQYRPYKKTLIDFAEIQPDAEKRTVRSAVSVRDSIVPEAVDAEYFNLIKKKRLGTVDLGTLGWVYNSGSDHQYYSNVISGIAIPPNDDTKFVGLCARYETKARNDSNIGIVGISLSSGGRINIVDKNFANSDVGSANLKTSLSGVYLIYKLATEEDVVVAENILFDEESVLIERGGTVTLTNASASEGCLPGLSIDIPVKRFQN